MRRLETVGSGLRSAGASALLDPADAPYQGVWAVIECEIVLCSRDDTQVRLLSDLIQQASPLAAGILFAGDRWQHVAHVARAVSDHISVGMATLAPCDEMGAGGPHIIGVYVLPAYRRQGIGRRLIAALVAKSQQEYGRGVTAECVTHEGLMTCSGVEGLTVRNLVFGNWVGNMLR